MRETERKAGVNIKKYFWMDCFCDIIIFIFLSYCIFTVQYTDLSMHEIISQKPKCQIDGFEPQQEAINL